MSDLTTLSRAFWAGAALSEELNRALIVLKKALWNIGGRSAAKPSDIAVSRARLLEIVTVMQEAIEGDLVRQHGGNAPERIPVTVTAFLRSDQPASLGDGRAERTWREELGRLASRLEQGEEPLSADDIRSLDRIAACVAAERSRAYSEIARR